MNRMSIKQVVAPRTLVRPKTWQQEQQLKFNERFAKLIGREAPEYECYDATVMEDLAFQRELVDQCVAHADKFWGAALAMGIGKSVIAARLAARYIDKGPVIYVSPSAASIGDLEDGVINKFRRGLALDGRPDAALGPRNDLSLAHDVSFVTPWYLANLLKRDRARVLKMLAKVSCLIVDEAHRFPEDEKDELVVYGQIFKATQKITGRIAVLTGTWNRLDKQRIMGVKAPSAVISMKKAVEMGRCAELFGIQVVTKVAGPAKVSGDLYDFHLSKKQRAKYLTGVADYVLRAHRMYPKPFAVFTRSIADAEKIATSFNRCSGLGKEGIALLTAKTPTAERKRIITGIQAGTIQGYATCAVGEEAIDIPELSVVHLVRRTKSVVRNLQAIGRAMRTRPGKKAIVVDYQAIVGKVKKHFVGVSLDDLSTIMGRDDRDPFRTDGDMLDRSTGPKRGVLVGMTMEEERALILAVENPVVVEEPEPHEDPAVVRERIEVRVDKVIGMLGARGVTPPPEWRGLVVEKLMGAQA